MVDRTACGRGSADGGGSGRFRVGYGFAVRWCAGVAGPVATLMPAVLGLG